VQADLTTQTLNVTYDLSDAENEDCEVSLYLSINDGRTYALQAAGASGDIGFPVSPGTAKSISWNYDGQVDPSAQLRLKVIADDRLEINIEDIIAAVDSNRLKERMNFIEGIRHRTTGVAHLEAVKDSIENSFVQAGIRSEVLPFDFGSYEAHNYQGVLQGAAEDARFLLLGGHFDTVDDSPGADDNGTAIAGMWEALEVMKAYQFNKTIKFIGFDLEENGLNGSRDYVDKLPDDETLEGFLNLEMIGYATEEPNTQTLPIGFELLFPEATAQLEMDEFRGNFINIVGNGTHADFQMQVETAFSQYCPDLKRIGLISPGSGTSVPDLARSDHAPFWFAGLPAVMLTDGANFRNPFYHSPNDLANTLNYTFMWNVVKASIATVAEIAEPVHVGMATAEVPTLVDVSDLDRLGIRLYPNPADQIIIVEQEQATVLSLQIINGLGQVVKEQALQDNRSVLDISSLSPGVYYVLIDQQRLTKILIDR
ncbi:MAG: M20/M25/M40 family metallo-hydrolase, partial [Bacteroidota bacterium]